MLPAESAEHPESIGASTKEQVPGTTRWANTPCCNREIAHLERLASLGALSASITHEVKNGLVAIKTLVNLLLEKHPETELASMARNELLRIERLVSQALNLAAPSAPTLAQIHLHETLDGAMLLANSQAKERGIAVDSELKARNDAVQGDPALLQQAFLNLLLNAFEAIGQHGQVKIGTKNTRAPGSSSELIEVAIQDNGPGIPAENFERIFDDFFTTKSAGTGLGLPITRRIMQSHGGTLDFESQSGQGTAFYLRFPVVAM